MQMCYTAATQFSLLHKLILDYDKTLKKSDVIINLTGFNMNNMNFNNTSFKIVFCGIFKIVLYKFLFNYIFQVNFKAF